MPISPPQEITLTSQQLITICKSTSGYSTPSLNDRLYLHYKKLTHLKNLQPYSGLLVLYAEGNQLHECSGLDGPHTTLKCLYLQQNSISDISTLSICTKLTTLNLASNMITSLTSDLPFSSMKSLHTLNLASNQLKSITDLHGLLQCRSSLSCLDLSYNQLSVETEEDRQQLFEFFTSFESLKILYLHHNPLYQQLPSYRKSLIAQLIDLTYLDERPVTESDHRLAIAYVKGGMEGQKQERQLIAEEVRQNESQRLRNVCELVDAPAAADNIDETLATSIDNQVENDDAESSDSDTDDVENIQQFANQHRDNEDDLHIQRVMQKWESRIGGGSTIGNVSDEEQISVVEQVVDSSDQPPIRSQGTAVVSVDTMD